MVDTIIRCPYCVQSDLEAFMPMVATDGGTCLCLRCGHVAIPGNKSFRCLCTHCHAKEAFVPKEAQIRWRASA